MLVCYYYKLWMGNVFIKAGKMENKIKYREGKCLTLEWLD